MKKNGTGVLRRDGAYRTRAPRLSSLGNKQAGKRKGLLFPATENTPWYLGLGYLSRQLLGRDSTGNLYMLEAL